MATGNESRTDMSKYLRKRNEFLSSFLFLVKWLSKNGMIEIY